MSPVLERSLGGELPSTEEALGLAEHPDLERLMVTAAAVRDQGFHNVVTYSKKVFIPLTHLCRDVCHYCTFAKAPKKVTRPYLTVDEVLQVARRGAALGCKEALFTLGERPELRYKTARDALAEMGYPSTLAYLRHVAEIVFKETGLFPHLNPGTMTPQDIVALREVAPSMGIMLESAAERLTLKGLPHHGSPEIGRAHV